MTVEQALSSSGIDPREARLLLAHVTGFSAASVAAFPEKELPAQAEQRFSDCAARRKKGEPIAYIVGHKEFYGLELAVNPAVLIPRPETELVVQLALQHDFSSLVDLGTGSGAIALAIKKHRPRARVVAVESSAAALVLAQRNAAKHALQVEFRHGRWFEPLENESFDLVVANPPYVAAGDPHLAELGFEPRAALLAGADGLDAIREIVSQVRPYLAGGGWLYVEHGMGQDAEVRELFERAGLESVASRRDLAGIARVTGGKR
ncbi:MAG: protein-(glutamine-N5) methyltransferase, release factor-specific [Betaproteobacteria bacterium 13_1_20CM_3_63_8]|nr:MAG: protein-(glutamine-N5) methyltransferase, release factor-specific [Betaproteobacteria bacterium 13_1_20CM_3_63_8]